MPGLSELRSVCAHESNLSRITVVPVTNERDDEAFRAQVIAAVQAELDRHAERVLAETEELRSGLRADLIREFSGDVAAAEQRLEQRFGQRIDATVRLVDESDRGRREETEALEQRLIERITSMLEERTSLTDSLIAESEIRSTRRAEQALSDLERTIETVTEPHLRRLREEQSSVTKKLDSVSGDLRIIDQQAARMVQLLEERFSLLEEQTGDLEVRVAEDTTRRLSGLDQRIEEAMALSLRQHTELTERIRERTEQIEALMNERAFALEDRVRAEAGQRIAEIDAHLGRVSQGLDATVEVLNDRIVGLERRIEELDGRIETIRAEVQSVDSEEFEAIKEKVSSALGEATLVRIDMERFEKRASEQADELAVRVAGIEAELADATMDVSTAVQLERLEELERAVIELDPSRFVLKDSGEMPKTEATDSSRKDPGSTGSETEDPTWH